MGHAQTQKRRSSDVTRHTPLGHLKTDNNCRGKLVRSNADATQNLNTSERARAGIFDQQRSLSTNRDTARECPPGPGSLSFPGLLTSSPSSILLDALLPDPRQDRIMIENVVSGHVFFDLFHCITIRTVFPSKPAQVCLQKGDPGQCDEISASLDQFWFETCSTLNLELLAI